MPVKVVNANNDFEMTLETGVTWSSVQTAGGVLLHVLGPESGNTPPECLATFAPGCWTHVTTGQ